MWLDSAEVSRQRSLPDMAPYRQKLFRPVRVAVALFAALAVALVFLSPMLGCKTNMAWAQSRASRQPTCLLATPTSLVPDMALGKPSRSTIRQDFRLLLQLPQFGATTISQEPIMVSGTHAPSPTIRLSAMPQFLGEIIISRELSTEPGRSGLTTITQPTIPQPSFGATITHPMRSFEDGRPEQSVTRPGFRWRPPTSLPATAINQEHNTVLGARGHTTTTPLLTLSQFPGPTPIRRTHSSSHGLPERSVTPLEFPSRPQTPQLSEIVTYQQRSLRAGMRELSPITRHFPMPRSFGATIILPMLSSKPGLLASPMTTRVWRSSQRQPLSLAMATNQERSSRVGRSEQLTTIRFSRFHRCDGAITTGRVPLMQSGGRHFHITLLAPEIPMSNNSSRRFIERSSRSAKIESIRF